MSSWKNLPSIAKFSIVAFVIALITGLMSLGKAGITLRYAVSFALPESNVPWASTMIAGMAWSVGFLVAGWTCSEIKNNSKWLIYLLILWLWDYIVWLAVIKTLHPY